MANLITSLVFIEIVFCYESLNNCVDMAYKIARTDERTLAFGNIFFTILSRIVRKQIRRHQNDQFVSLNALDCLPFLDNSIAQLFCAQANGMISAVFALT